jgi:hypothetical protein
MSTDQDTTRIVRSWLRTDEYESADRVLEAALVAIDTTPQRRAWWPARRFPPMSNMLRISLATAAVAVLAFLGIRFLGGGTNLGNPSETARPNPSQTPAAFSELSGAIPPGPVILDGAFPLAVEFDVPAGWSANATDARADQVDISKVRGDQSPVWVSFSTVDNVFPDPCHPVAMDPPLGPTVDDVVAAFTSLEGFEVGEVSDVDVDGHPGRQFDLTTSVIPADAGCDDEVWLSLWTGTDGFTAQIPGPTSMRFTVVDVDGTRLVISTQSGETTTSAELAEAYAIIDSVRFQ